MKKNYSAPDIFYESFSLSTCIAGDCDKIIDTKAVNMCSLVTGGLNLFLTDMSACNKDKDGAPAYPVNEDQGGYDGICYHVPQPGSALFNS